MKFIHLKRMKVSLLLLASLLTCIVSMAQEPERSTITVHTAEEFILAVGPNRTIIIDAKAPLNLTKAFDESKNLSLLDEDGWYSQPCVPERYVYLSAEEREAMEEEYDEDENENEDENEDGDVGESADAEEEALLAKELEDAMEALKGYHQHVVHTSMGSGQVMLIHDCPGLSIRSANAAQPATFFSPVTDCNALSFIDCEDLQLLDLNFVHADQAEDCTCVLYFERCQHVTAQHCTLNCKGAAGMMVYGCDEVVLDNCSILKYSSFAENYDSRQVSLKNCTLVDAKNVRKTCTTELKEEENTTLEGV